MRIDKFLWCIRLFKTRPLAAKACSNGRIRINGKETKPSKLISPEDIFELRVTPIWRTFKIIEIPKSRVGAKLVDTLVIETTAQQDLKQLKEVEEMNRQNKLMGIKGRPTKKDQRDLKKFKGDGK